MFESDDDEEMELSNSDEADSDDDVDLSFGSDVDSPSFDPNFFRSFYKQNSWIQFSYTSEEKEPSDSERTQQVHYIVHVAKISLQHFFLIV